jgi:hypothetical protein
MLLTFNKQNFEILECVVLALFFYMVYTIFIRDKLGGKRAAGCAGCAGCAGHKKERFTNMGGMLPKKVEGYGYGHKTR